MDPAQALITILFGALAGGITNTVAIWMLFHPYEPPRLLGRSMTRLQGAIPKNKARLASRIGRTVGTRLLTPEDLARTVAEPSFRAAFDERLSAFLGELLHRERGSVLDELPPAVASEVSSMLEQASESLLDRLDEYLAGGAFQEAAGRWAADLAREIAEQPIGDVLTREREDALARTVDGWLADATGGESFEAAVHDYFDGAARRILAPGRTFEEILPVGLVASFERAVSGYLPLALERLSRLLEDPEARERVERIVHEILDRFMRDLKFHQRLVAALVITPETVDRVLRAIEAEGAEKLSELLHDPAVRDAMARGVNEAVVDFLRRPADSVLGKPGEESVESARRTAADWLIRLARDEDTRGFVIQKLRATLGAAERRTWADIFRRIPPERLADLAVRASRSPEARGLLREALARARVGLLRRPIGRPADLLPSDAAARLEGAISEPLWAWIQEEVPAIAQRIDIAGKVERKILDYPTPRLEELIRSVTQRELRLIVRLGYVLGAVVGSVLVGVTALLG